MAPSNLRLNPWGALVFLIAFFLALGYVFGPPDFFRREQRVSLKELLTVSIGLASKGGVKVKEIHEQHKLNEKVKGQTQEGAKEMLTSGDLESHKIIFYGFSKMYPGIKVVSEEHDNKPVDFNQISAVPTQIPEVEEAISSDQSIPISDITIWIDPLDATQEYTMSLTQYVTTMVCVVVRGEPKIGVINRPFSGETVWAWNGYGHSKNLEVGPGGRGKGKQHSLIVSLSHKGDVETMAKSALNDVDIVAAGGAGYKTLEVIKGSVNAYTHITRIKKWDICAGNAILNALGGKMTTLDGDYINYSPNLDAKNERGLLATVNNRLHYEYLEKLGAKAKEILEKKSASASHG